MFILCVVFTCEFAVVTTRRGVDASKAGHYDAETDFAKSIAVIMQ